MSKRFMRIASDASLLSKGRPGDPKLGEWVKVVDSLPQKTKGVQGFILFGCADDTGVTLNRGRAGARSGPDGIRKHLYKMTPPMDFDWEKKISLYDFGNLIPSKDILATHQAVNEIAHEIASLGHFGIFLGGGHDFAAPIFEGFQKAFGKRMGLLNVDPHLDVRPLENDRPHSGTPFRQLLDGKSLRGEDFTEFGTRQNRNAREHYDYCRKKKVRVLTLEEIRSEKLAATDNFKKELKRLTQKLPHVAVTLDMDACADGEGTSAAPVLGFSAWEMVRMAALAGSEKKVSYLELAEVAPPLDSHDRIGRIAAESAYALLLNRAKIL